MANFNRVILMGNITRDIEVRYVSNGLAVTDITLAVNDRRKKDNEWIEETSFIDVTLWGRNAEVVGEYLGKGSPLFVEGRLKQETWESDGQKRSKIKVIGERTQFIGGKGEGSRGGGSRQSTGEQSSYNEPISSSAGSSSAGSSSGGSSSGGSSSGGSSSGGSSSGGSSSGGSSSGGGHGPEDDIPF